MSERREFQVCGTCAYRWQHLDASCEDWECGYLELHKDAPAERVWQPVSWTLILDPTQCCAICMAHPASWTCEAWLGPNFSAMPARR